jgi:hypothetical protein
MVLNTMSSFECSSCAKSCTPEKSEKNAILCMANGTVTFFCVSCWDEEDWECHHCGSVPDDSHVIGCELCGQWFHQDCQYHIDSGDGFHCDDCTTSNVSSLKETIFDTKAALELSTKRTKELMNKCDAFDKAKVSRANEFGQKMANAKKVHLSVTNELKQEIEKVRSSHGELRTSKNLYKNEMKRCLKEKQKLIGEKRKLSSEIQFLSEDIRQKIVENDSLKSLAKSQQTQTHDYLRMVETMNQFVKRQKMEWTYSPPVRLHPNDEKLWKAYQCKVRKVNGQDVFGADKIARSNSIEPLLVHSLKEMLQIASKIHANKN